MSQWRIGEILVQKNLLNWDNLRIGLEEQQRSGGLIGEILIRRGAITKQLFFKALAEQFGLRWIDLKQFHINPKAFECVPRSLLREYGIVPIDLQERTLVMAISDPLRKWPEEAICGIAGVHEIHKVLCTPEDIDAVLNHTELKAR